MAKKTKGRKEKMPKGVSDKKYDAYFIAMLMINKYFMSVALYRQEKSTPVMEELKVYLEEQKLAFEPNSAPGKAIDYILSRWTQLSQFLRQAYAPLDTNIVERALKLVIQVRKSSMFYKTLSSAAFASYVQSALYSAAQNEINPCDYMCALIENEEAVIQHPNAWLPWRYQETLKQNLAEHTKREASEPVSPD